MPLSQQRAGNISAETNCKAAGTGVERSLEILAASYIIIIYNYYNNNNIYSTSSLIQP